MNSYLSAFLTALLVALVSTRWVRELAKRRGWLDQPDAARKLHPRPVPRIGGVAIYLSLVLALLVSLLLPTTVGDDLRQHALRAAAILGLGACMLGIGLWDDLKGLPAWAKFSTQAIVAVAGWTLGFRVIMGWGEQQLGLPSGILSLPLTILWLVGITNAFNLIDGVDGLTAGTALFSMISMLVLAVVNNHPTATLILVALAGATLGFLRYNFNPASIFLGDSGSLTLGFLLAILAMETSQKSTTAFTIALPIVSFGLPVLDTALSVVRRFLSGKEIFGGDRRHIHHVLMASGLSPRKVVMILYGVSGLFGLFSLMFLNPGGKPVGALLTILGLCVWIGVQRLRYPEFREFNEYVVRGLQHQRELIAGNLVIGSVIDRLRRSCSMTDVLAGLSLVLEEMEFSTAEVRMPAGNVEAALGLPGWTARTDGPLHALYQWRAANDPNAAGGGVSRVRAFRSSGADRDLEFRIEFVFRVPAALESHKRLRGITVAAAAGADIGRLTFFHPADTRYPVLAICLLSRNVWKEFGSAVERILAPDAGSVETAASTESAPAEAPVLGGALPA